MSRAVVTVAIPVLDGGELFRRSLDSIARQRVNAEVELLVADSGSADGSLDAAREHGAHVIEIERSSFGHGRTRNTLLAQARGTHVALLTQDAEPASEHWLAMLLSAFELSPDVALAYGPYLPRPDASPLVRSELARWFGSLTPGSERLEPAERDCPPAALMGRRGFFSDANGCIARAAWERVPFREIPYAEDRCLALDMLRAGFAKVYEPRAGVLHSHEYGPRERFQRAFDESRGLLDVYGWREPTDPRHLASQIRGELGALRREGGGAATLITAAGEEAVRLAGAVVGSRSARLPAWLQRACSLEGRADRPIITDPRR
ncbi:MAG TPA: glycosyltransferase [Solirubrobacteraceae bacterium]|nr:glycosyltransferase [Solirubrobacteraceae bacterium]